MMPKKIDLGSIVYSILPIKDLLDDERAKKITGQISINDATIKIENDINSQLQAMTIIHEIIHHILMVSGHDEDIRPEIVEDFIDALANGMLITMRLNPDLIKFIGELDDRPKDN